MPMLVSSVCAITWGKRSELMSEAPIVELLPPMRRYGFSVPLDPDLDAKLDAALVLDEIDHDDLPDD